MDYIAKSLRDIAEGYVKDQVLSAQLQSGDKVIEADIADVLSISRAPVREALKALSQQGMIIFSPRRGHFVPEMSREEIFEVFQIRISLELQVMRILIYNKMLHSSDYDALLDLSKQMKEAGQKTTEESQRIYLLNNLDISFHRYLWNASKSHRRAGLLEGLFFQLLIVMNNNVESLGSGDEKAEEHFLLVEALKTNDIAKVCSELRHHLDKYIIAALGTLSEEETNILEAVFHPE